MSKTAVIISGELRSFDRCLPNLAHMVFRHFGDCDFFVSTVADADAHKADLLRLRYPAARVEIEVVPEQPDCVADMRAKGVVLPATWTPGQFYTHEPYFISVNPQAILRQLWQLEQGWNLLEKTAGAAGAGYDLIVRCRPDLWFHSGVTREHIPPNSAFTPWFGGFGGCNDRFALLGAAAAEQYFHTYQNTPRLMAAGCPLHPESLVLASLEGCKVQQTLPVEFSTLRTDGAMRPPEIQFSDLAHLLEAR